MLLRRPAPLALVPQSRWVVFGLLVSGVLGIASPAIATAQPVNLTQTSTSTALTPMAAPRVIDDPTLFLPTPSDSISLLVLNLSERRLYGYQGDRLVATYTVAVGRAEWETPTGEFTVTRLQAHPTWQHPFTGELVPPGPDNPLGARWIGFWTDGTNAIGFHGTPHEHLIGQAVSHGCVRMRDADIVELFERVRVGTRVVVQS
ncbi:MAG: L,D-transpeptidase [Leptolyngbya sp. SIOISBB]|nr:L,D-transpeptidase [Leptolyngbya sp. SIOISBB]